MNSRWIIEEVNCRGTYIEVLGWYEQKEEAAFILGELDYPRMWFLDRTRWCGHIFWDIHNIDTNADLLHDDNHYSCTMAEDIAGLLSSLAESCFSI